MFVVLMLFFGFGKASAENQNTSPTQSSLILTHFMFTQVIQSYIEDGDRYIIEDLAGNSERSYEFILEKKFFVAFLKRWQEVISQPSNNFHSSIDVFHSILSEPGYLSDNAFYLLKTIGLSKDFKPPLDHHLMISSGPVVDLGRRSYETLNNLGLHPYEEYALDLGYARSPLLMRILASEKELSPEKRALVLLDELARFMAYEKRDRKTIIWLTAYFLRDTSSTVREKAQAVLANIDSNEIVDSLADLRWLIMGGSALLAQAFRTEVLAGVYYLQNSALIQKILGWTKYFSSRSIVMTKTLKDYSKIALMSVQRYISVLQPETKAATASVFTAIAGHWYVYKSIGGDEPDPLSTLQTELNQSLATLGLPADPLKAQSTLTSYGADNETSTGHGISPAEEVKRYQLDRYLTKSPYSGLHQFDPLPLSLLNEVEKFNLVDQSNLTDRARNLLAQNQFKLDGQFDYKGYFLQQEYNQMLHESRIRDLRLISMAAFVLNKRISEIRNMLQINGTTNFNQLNYDDWRAAIQKVLALLNKNHTAYYSADSRSLLREALGEGGNCVAIALLQFSVLAPVWGSGDWELGVVFPPQHMLLAAFNRKLGLVVELDSMSEKNLTDYPYDILHPHLLVASAMGPVLAIDYVMRKAEGSTTLQSWQDEVEKNGLSFKPSNLLKKGVDKVKASIKNQVANVAASIIHTPSLRPSESNTENPQFALDLIGTGQKSPKSSTFEQWGTKIGQ
jgi:hypothetical protein